MLILQINKNLAANWSVWGFYVEIFSIIKTPANILRVTRRRIYTRTRGRGQFSERLRARKIALTCIARRVTRESSHSVHATRLLGLGAATKRCGCPPARPLRRFLGPKQEIRSDDRIHSRKFITMHRSSRNWIFIANIVKFQREFLKIESKKL